MKRTLFSFFIILLQFAVSLNVNAGNTIVNKGTITIYVDEEKTLYHSIPYQYYVASSSWFLRETTGSAWSDGQEKCGAKIVDKNSSSCTIRGMWDNSGALDMSHLELHCKGTRQSIGEYYECYWTIIVKSYGSLRVSADPAGGKIDAGSKVTLTAKSNGNTVSGCDIYYTLDGTTPTKSSTKYTSSGITINSSCWLSARAYKTGYETNAADEWYYTVNNLVTSITLNKTSLSLQPNQSETLQATVKPDNATNKKVNWESSDTSVATVDSNGKVTAKSVSTTSTATITCSAADGSGVKATCSVTVQPSVILVEKITLNKTTLSLTTGQTETLTATVKPDNATNKKVKWESSNTSVATVDSNGKVTAVAAGTATITCSATDGSGVKATCNVTVTEKYPEPDLVSVVCKNSNPLQLTNNDNLLLAATFDNNGVAGYVKTVAAIMAKDEDLTLVEVGDVKSDYFAASQNTTLNYSLSLKEVPEGDYYASVLFYIQSDDEDVEGWYYHGKWLLDIHVGYNPDIKVASITLNKTSLSLQTGQEETLKATVKPDNATNKTVNWSSSPTGIVTVDNGKVTAVAAGTTTITCSATDGSGVKATCSVTVTAPDPYANVIYMDPAYATSGSSVTIPVRMKNAQANISGFQFDLVLPTGVTLAKDEDDFYMVELSTERTSAKKHTVSSQLQNDGSIRVVCYSNNNSTFSGTEGNVLELTLNVASSMTEGDYVLKLRNEVMTTPNMDSYNVSEVVSKLTIEDFILGDVNGDGKVDVVDVTGAVNLALNSGDTSKLNRKAADINGDGIINVVDVAGIVNIILNGNGGKSRAMAPTRAGGQPLLYFNSEPIQQDETITLPIILNGAGDSFTGCQFDLYLPKGLSVAEEDGYPLVEVGSGTTARKHTVSTSEQADGSLRVVCYSNNNSVFTGPEILTVAIHAAADAPVGNASVSLRNITLSGPDVTGVDLADYDNGLIVIESGIEGMLADKPTVDKVFSLSGQRLAAPRKGINIVGGEKIIIK